MRRERHICVIFKNRGGAMVQLKDITIIESGTSQFRINETQGKDVPIRFFYGQAELEADLTSLASSIDPKQIRTSDEVSTLKDGDLVFSLISGKSTIVKPWHEGYAFTQNYVRIAPAPLIDACFLAYLLNENEEIKRQLAIGQQGSITLKYTVRQLSNLQLPNLLPIKRQKIIGDLYFRQLKLAALEKRLADSETKLVLQKLKEACD